MKKFKVIIFKTLITIGILALLAVAAIGIAKEVQNHSKPAGFDSVLLDKDFCTLAIDGDKLWGGGSNGLFMIDMKTLGTTEIKGYQFVRALLVTKDGLWIGHDGGVSFQTKGTGQVKTFTQSDGLPDNRVNALMQDHLGNIWIGTWGGAVKYDGKNFTTYTSKNGLLVDMVNVITEDSRDGIWFGSYVAPRGGISVLREAKWQYFTPNDALLHANINTIISLKDGNILAGGGLYTQGGASLFGYEDSGWSSLRTYTLADGLAGAKVRSAFEDSKGRLWLGSEYDGAVIMSGKLRIALFNTKSGLSSDEVKEIVEDSAGNMWLGTRRGVTRILKAIL